MSCSLRYICCIIPCCTSRKKWEAAAFVCLIGQCEIPLARLTPSQPTMSHLWLPVSTLLVLPYFIFESAATFPAEPLWPAHWYNLSLQIYHHLPYGVSRINRPFNLSYFVLEPVTAFSAQPLLRASINSHATLSAILSLLNSNASRRYLLM